MRKVLFSVVILLVILPTLACNLGGLLGDGEQAQIEVAQSEEEAQAEPPVEASSAAADEPVANSIDDSTAELESESSTEPEPAESIPTEAETAESGAGEANQSGVGNGGSATGVRVELNNVSGLDKFSSYRVLLTMDLTGQSGGQPVEGAIKILLEETTDPAAKHVLIEMSGSPMAMLGGTETLEFYDVGGTTYLYNEMLGAEWVSAPSDGSSDPLAEGLFAPDEELQLPESAICAEEPETINNIETRYCTFNEIDLTDSPDASYGSADGEVWLAMDGNYVVKYAVTLTDFRPGAEDQSFSFESGDWAITYDLLEVNTGFAITAPEEAGQAGGLDLGDLGGDSGNLPVMDDAQEFMSFGGIANYKTDYSVAEVVDFYNTELAAQGWSSVAVDGVVTDTSAILTFEKDSGVSLLVTIAEENGKVAVTLIEANEE